MKFMRTFGACLIALVGTPAIAADMAIKAPPTPALVRSDGFYAWVDSSWQSVSLPSYALGWKAGAFGSPDTPPSQRYQPHPTGAGLGGGIGYILPYGMIPTVFGTNGRIELSVSYLNATQRQTGSTSPVNILQMVGGLVPIACGAGCTTSSTLSTDYSTWQANLKGASDFKSGAITITPSISGLAGPGRVHQDFSQSLAGGVAPYTADSVVKWTDWGAKFGLDATVELAPPLSVGAGGSIGFARRVVSMTANDVETFPAMTTTAATASASTTPLLANAEARVTARPTSNFAVMAFGGLNYDSRVPGLAGPTFNGPEGVIPFQGNAAGIKFEKETSYYVGGRLVVKFGNGPTPVIVR